MIKTFISRTSKIRSVFLLSSILLLAIATGCSDKSENKTSEKKPGEKQELYTGDFNTILSKKQIRVLIPRTKGNTYLPRQGFPLDIELEQIQQFAAKHQLSVKKVYVPDFDQLIPNLIDGHGDIIAANLTVTEERKEFIDYSLPIHHVRQQILQAADSQVIREKNQLKNKKIAVKPSSSFWPTAHKLKERYPSIQVVSLANHLDIDEILDKISNNTFDVTIQDTNLIASVKTYRSDIKESLILTNEQAIAWGVRQNSPDFKKALNEHIQQQELQQSNNTPYTTDLKSIKKRNVIRMITRNNAANYFLYKGQLLGFEYELAQQFAKANKLNLEIIVAPDNEDLFDWLLQGKGDFIAASLSPTKKRLEKDIKFSRYYIKSNHQLVQRKGEKLINSGQQLNGRTIAIRKSSAYLETVNRLINQGFNIEIEYVPEELETEDIINRVAIGKYDLTIADGHLLDLELLWRDDIQPAMLVSDINKIGWVTRSNNPELLKAINHFHKKNYKSLIYNLTYKKYFEKASHKTSEETNNTHVNSLSPYDDLVKKYASQYGFDWKLITAQMYQESRFNPEARSWVGAQGLLQVMPRTGEEFGFKNLTHPETGLHAGIKYMQWVQNRFDHELPVKDRMWFTLAAYNAGIGHVRDARRLARKMGWNPNRWFNNVERAMLLLRLKKYYKKARFGFVRGREPVHYVRSIKHHYEAYSELLTAQADTVN